MNRPLPPVKADALPEHKKYRDDGCELSQSCLSCPLPACKYDSPGLVSWLSFHSRDSELLRLRAEGESVAELASRFRMSTRTVHRIVQRGALPPSTPWDKDEAPLLTLADLARRSLFRVRTPLPPLGRPQEPLKI